MPMFTIFLTYSYTEHLINTSVFYHSLNDLLLLKTYTSAHKISGCDYLHTTFTMNIYLFKTILKDYVRFA